MISPCLHKPQLTPTSTKLTSTGNSTTSTWRWSLDTPSLCSGTGWAARARSPRRVGTRRWSSSRWTKHRALSGRWPWWSLSSCWCWWWSLWERFCSSGSTAHLDASSTARDPSWIRCRQRRLIDRLTEGQKERGKRTRAGRRWKLRGRRRERMRRDQPRKWQKKWGIEKGDNLLKFGWGERERRERCPRNWKSRKCVFVC